MLFSVKSLEHPNKNRVIAHSKEIYLKDVSFKVSETGRQRVIQEKRKNVHAGVVGTLISPEDIPKMISYQGLLFYNPYVSPKFRLKYTDTEANPFYDYCLINLKGIFVYNKLINKHNKVEYST